MSTVVHSANFSAFKTIIALDMDYFYCQVELRKRPDIDRNRPVGAFQRNLVVTCNYPARAAGVKKLMLVKDAIACSEIISLIKDTFGVVAVENLGLDEFFIDVTKILCDREEEYSCETSIKGFCWPVEERDSCICFEKEEAKPFVAASHLCFEIRETIKSKLQLTCSGGLSNSKLLSKLAASIHKPDEQTVILPQCVESYLSNLNLRKLPGIGSATYQSLVDHFLVSTCEQLRCIPVERLVEVFGSRLGIRLFNICRGIDEESVHDTSLVKSISCEERFSKTERWSEVERYLGIVVERLLDRLVEHATVFAGRYGRLLIISYLRSSSTRRESISCNVPFDVIRLCTLCNSIKSPSNDYCDKFSNLRRSALKQLEGRCFDLLRERLGSDFVVCLVSVGVGNFVTLNDEEPTSRPNSIVSFFQRRAPNSTCSYKVSEASSPEAIKCCICDALLNANMSNEDINRHIDKCLSMKSFNINKTQNALDGFIKSRKRKASSSSSYPLDGTETS
ncbi:DNA polymerase iota [Galdieria sulphuraria]|nr:DNA polymerase iota [Galdieria sulphuraria]